MKTLKQQIKTVSGKFVKSTTDQSLHPVTVFKIYLKEMIRSIFVSLLIFGAGIITGVVFW